MGFDNTYYLRQLELVEGFLKNGYKTPSQLMNEYKVCIEVEDYEKAKAITEVLLPLGFFTNEMHPKIDCLWNH